MALKALLHLFAAFLLLSMGVQCRDEEYKTEAPYTKVPPPAPVQASPPLLRPPTPTTPSPPKAPLTPAPPVKPPTYKPSPPVKPPTTPQAPPMAPITPSPPVKSPSYPAPPKAPTPTPPSPPMMPPVPKKDCVPLCEKRCGLHSRKRVCMRACTTCCERCKCVPPGTYGNKEMCGKCYSDMTTHGGRPKCP